MEGEDNPGDLCLPWVKLNTHAAYPYENKMDAFFQPVCLWASQALRARVHPDSLILPVSGRSANLVTHLSTME